MLARAMSLLRFLGLSGRDDAPRPSAERETETIRRIAAELEQLDAATAKYLAGFAYVLARIANADLHVDADETQAMQRALEELGSLSPAEAALAVEIAKSQTRLLGGTENYVVTREFKRSSTREQRGRLLHCLYAVAAADGSISPSESAEIVRVAEELGFTRDEANSLRAKYRDKLAVLKAGKR